jgi:hypothetical protein
VPTLSDISSACFIQQWHIKIPTCYYKSMNIEVGKFNWIFSELKCQKKNKTKETNSVGLVCERTIPTERPPLVCEVSANFCGWMVSRGQRDGSLRPHSRLSRPAPLLFLPSSSLVVLLFRKCGSAGNGTRDLWISGILTTRPQRRQNRVSLMVILRLITEHLSNRENSTT